MRPHTILTGIATFLVLGCGSDGKSARTAGTMTGGSGGASGSSGASGASGTAGNSTGGSSAGGSGNGGSSAGTGAGGTGVPPSPVCPTPPANACSRNTSLPSSAPSLTTGVWANISPPQVPFRQADVTTQGMALDPCDAGTVYVCVGGNQSDPATVGLFKTTNGGGTWRQVGALPGHNTAFLDFPIRVRINPANPQQLFLVDGVRGSTHGFWISCDGGETFALSESFVRMRETHNIYADDAYDVAVDPDDFNHVLVASHSIWGDQNTEWNGHSGVLESKDGGQTWIIHEPGGWGTGHAINFLYDKELGVGDSNTWLLGTQGPGMFRTTNAGQSWTKVSDEGIQHGGGTVFYDSTGLLVATAAYSIQTSRNNGETWTKAATGKGYNAVFGDGNLLYTSANFGPAPYITSPEGDGVTWTDQPGGQQFGQGPFEMAFDAANGIMYSANWQEGVFALKVR